MMIGFDYGTSNCAVGVMQDGSPQIVPLAEHGSFMPSTLYSPSRDVIVNWLQAQLNDTQKPDYALARRLQLQKGQGILRELSFDGISPDLYFGQAALAKYLDDPEEGYYIKSPKSFLGASGLKPQQIALFEDIVASMMAHVKQCTENSLQRSVSKTVIGRPVNFQGIRGEESNQQAIQVLTNAAKRVGFHEVEFQYEPVAAGLEYESTLTKETRVLVVDIGGGTTDCSMLLMGPKLSPLDDRTSHLLAHSGQRVGGNDFDIQLALKGLMPNLGLNSQFKTGKPMPINTFWQAVAINNINEQTEFYSQENERFLTQLIRDAEEPNLVERLLKVQQEKLSYQLVNSAEQAKITLSHDLQHQVDLSYLDSALTQSLTRDTLQLANKRELELISRLMKDAIEQAGCQPDVVFVTGGTAKSPVIESFLSAEFNGVDIVVGDHFGSVTAGLTRWAERVFK